MADRGPDGSLTRCISNIEIDRNARPSAPGVVVSAAGLSEYRFDDFHDELLAPAQQDSAFTSFLKVCAASFSPSTTCAPSCPT